MPVNKEEAWASPTDAISQAFMKNAYMRDRYITLRRLLLGLCIALSLCIIAMFILAQKPTKHVYFATGCDGRLFHLTPLNQPIMTDTELMNWTVASVTKTLSLDFENYRRTLSEVQDDYTPTGWTSLQKALKASHYLQTIQENAYVAQTTPTGAPVIANSGIMPDGVMGWKIEVPVVITYSSGSNNTSNNATIIVTVQRLPQTDTPKGVGIQRIIMH